MSTQHPTPDVLAGYIDAVLTPAERRDVERHLAECAACRESLTDTIAMLASEDEAGAVAAAPMARANAPSRSLRRVWIGFAAAAVIVVAAWGLIFSREGPSTSPARTELVSAFANEPRRPLEVRLTGGFGYAPPPAVNRAAGETTAADQSPEVRVAIASVERAAAEHDTLENRAALSVAQLIAGDVAAGIRGLESVTRERPDAQFLSDLSGAYLLDGLRTANSARFREAVDVADRALQIEMLPEALFNKAYALEQLGDTAAARAAWTAVREREPGSGWAAEADEHLRLLAAP